jgi:molecular chaperone GrpE (heat shock protein)
MGKDDKRDDRHDGAIVLLERRIERLEEQAKQNRAIIANVHKSIKDALRDALANAKQGCSTEEILVAMSGQAATDVQPDT